MCCYIYIYMCVCVCVMEVVCILLGFIHLIICFYSSIRQMRHSRVPFKQALLQEAPDFHRVVAVTVHRPITTNIDQEVNLDGKFLM